MEIYRLTRKWKRLVELMDKTKGAENNKFNWQFWAGLRSFRDFEMIVDSQFEVS